MQASSPPCASHWAPFDGAGVRIFAPKSVLRDMADRVALSNGTSCARNIAAAATFRDGARTPGTPWRTPSEPELNTLWTDAPLGRSHTVGLIRLFEPNPFDEGAGERLTIALRALRSGDATSLDHPALSALVTRISEFCTPHGAFGYRGYAEHPPGMPATTQAADGLHQGLHVDDGARLVIRDLANARTRLSVNLGEEDRYFLFLNQSVLALALHMWPCDQTERYRFSPGLADQIGLAFMRSYPSYPIVRLRIRPGEAYVASTESIVHDAASEGGRARGRHVTFTGADLKPLD